jgi:hypothetical protein
MIALILPVFVEVPVRIEIAIDIKRSNLSTASPPSSPYRAPVISMRSLTRYRHAPSITPVAMGYPLAR